MSPEEVMNLAYQGMRVALFLAGPVLLTALGVGLLVSLFQAATQVNEMTLTFIPKVLSIFAVLVIAGPWQLEVIITFTRKLFTEIPLMFG